MNFISETLWLNRLATMLSHSEGNLVSGTSIGCTQNSISSPALSPLRDQRSETHGVEHISPFFRLSDDIGVVEASEQLGSEDGGLRASAATTSSPASSVATTSSSWCSASGHAALLSPSFDRRGWREEKGRAFAFSRHGFPSLEAVYCFAYFGATCGPGELAIASSSRRRAHQGPETPPVQSVLLHSVQLRLPPTRPNSRPLSFQRTFSRKQDGRCRCAFTTKPVVSRIDEDAG